MEWNRQQIIDESIEVINTIGMQITVRQLYYQLVSKGLPNTQLHYKRVVAAMTKARWNYDVEFEAFIDRDREMWRRTRSEQKEVIDAIVKPRHK